MASSIESSTSVEAQNDDQSSTECADISSEAADNVQNSEMLESSRPRTPAVITEISEAEDIPNSESSSSARSSSSEEPQVNPIIGELKLDYPDIEHGYFNPFGEDIQNECPCLKKELEDGKGKIPELLKSGDIQGAKEQVKQVFYRFDAIQYVSTVLLPMHRSTKVMDDIKESKVDMGEDKQMKNGDGIGTTHEDSLLDLYRTIFTYALKDRTSKDLATITVMRGQIFYSVKYWEELEMYRQTEFMVFRCRKKRLL